MLSNEAVNYVVFDAGVSAAVVLNSYIGGVGTFLGPALGAAVMTFFGYAVSDTTQLWLLYQGMLFVLVMLFVPQGLTGLFINTAGLLRRHGAGRVLPAVLAAVAAALLLAAGTVFLAEMLQRLCSQDYRALAGMQPGWPPLQWAGRAWAPDAATTWLLPSALLAAGAVLARLARQRLNALNEQAAA